MVAELSLKPLAGVCTVVASKYNIGTKAILRMIKLLDRIWPHSGVSSHFT